MLHSCYISSLQEEIVFSYTELGLCSAFSIVFFFFKYSCSWVCGRLLLQVYCVAHVNQRYVAYDVGHMFQGLFFFSVCVFICLDSF